MAGKIHQIQLVRPSTSVVDQSIIIERGKIRSISNSHPYFGEKYDWIHYIYKIFAFSKTTRVSQIVKNEYRDIQVYAIIECTEQFSALHAFSGITSRPSLPGTFPTYV